MAKSEVELTTLIHRIAAGDDLDPLMEDLAALTAAELHIVLNAANAKGERVMRILADRLVIDSVINRINKRHAVEVAKDVLNGES